MEKIELNQIIRYLQGKDDPKSLAQLDVLEHRMKESQVFRKYVILKKKEERNEEIFFAARDAAQFLSGKLDLSGFLPDVTVQEIEEVVNSGTITLTMAEYNSIIQRLERIEMRLRLRTGKKAVTEKNLKDVAEGEMMNQKQTIDYCGYSRTTLLRWVEKGLVTRYRKAGKVYYSKQEVDKALEMACYNKR